jgi:hypothetical protein
VPASASVLVLAVVRGEKVPVTPGGKPERESATLLAKAIDGVERDRVGGFAQLVEIDRGGRSLKGKIRQRELDIRCV